jgi:hypothetical protein
MSRDYVERHRRLDMHELKRLGVLAPGVSAIMTWTSNGEHRGKIFCVAEKGKIILHYYCQGSSQDWGRVEQEIFIEWTPCNYGGRRPWFICRCSRRVAVLYAAGKLFRCRKCYGLIHRSANESKHNRNYRKMVKIRRRLGYDNDIMKPMIFKPKGMHYTTFRRLLDEYNVAEEIHLQPLINALLRMQRQLGQRLW